ncbi:hypothetical protein [Tunicatimonas pelagia]|uniref:hypothetical protein n=1 Tax=Tunicatimonas pelagia TaxID=931531 RepID=UPI0026662A0B|nr:hypothetical protein [Tunicatimonas pelagia]WKN43984.1 hypothetical protein P0M28_03230 [Tunicatimonas pelagia]
MNLRSLYQAAKKELEALNGGEFVDFRLEQAERNDKDNLWEIVVSYLVENKNPVVNRSLSPLSMSDVHKYNRIYKSVKIDDNMEVVGLRIFS